MVDSPAETQRSENKLRSSVHRARFYLPGFSSLTRRQRQKAIAAAECRLVRSPTRGSNAKHHLRAAVQLDILFGAKQDAGSLRHSGILLPRRIVGQQHAGYRRGSDGDVAVSGYDGPRCGDTVSCGSCPGFGARALRRAACPAAAIGTACARAR